MPGHEAILIGLAVVSEVLGTLGGFGSSTFFVPLASLLEGIRVVLAVTSLLHVFSNFAKLGLLGRYVDRGLVVRFLPTTLLLTSVGAWLTTRVSGNALTGGLGAILVALSVTFLARPRLKLATSTTAVVGASALSGFLTGLVGTGGAIRGLALTAFDLRKNTFVATSAAIDLLPDALRAFIYLREGYLDRSHFFYVPLLALAAYGGTILGTRLLKKVSERAFRKVVLGLVLAIGAFTLVRALAGSA